MSDLVENPEYRFSRVAAHIILIEIDQEMSLNPLGSLDFGIGCGLQAIKCTFLVWSYNNPS